MTTGDGFRRLADLLDALDTTDVDVLDVSVASGDESTLVADLQMEVPVDGTVDPVAGAASTGGSGDGVDVDTGGRDDHDASSPEGGSAEGRDREDVDPAAGAGPDEDAAPDEADGTEEPSTTSATEGADSVDGVACRAPDCGETFETEHGMKIHHTKVHGPSLEDEQPAYRDPDRLREAYEAHSSFAAMRDALGVDVSAQTVRRNAIRHGIHEPAGGAEAASDEAESRDDADEPTDREQSEPAGGDPAGNGAREGHETVVDGGRAVDAGARTTGDGSDRTADRAERAGNDRPEGGSSGVDLPDVDLPDGVELADVKAAVESASTLYEVQRALDVDRERATALLRELGLLELVHGRVATKRRREDLKEEIDQRIRERAASG